MQHSEFPVVAYFIDEVQGALAFLLIAYLVHQVQVNHHHLHSTNHLVSWQPLVGIHNY